MNPNEFLLAASGLQKSFGPVPVLVDVHFDLRRGEVHALVGENGAGKSTLSRILAGFLSADGGSIRIKGHPYSPRNKVDAEQHGVRMVMQELNLVGNLSVAESIFIDRIPNRLGWVDYARLHCDARKALVQVGLGGLDPQTMIRDLGVGKQQLVEIAAGLCRRCEILILDEPTAALTDPEIEHLFARIAELKAAGCGIVYISHRMDEIRRIADRISVLRDGRMVATREAAGFFLDEVVRLMVGRDIDADVQRASRSKGARAMRVEGLTRRPAVHEVGFELFCGEILGFGGLMGSGRTELMRLIFGADQPDSGAIYLKDSKTPATIRSPRDAVKLGIALLTEDRKQQGLFLPMGICPNITLPSLGRHSRRCGWVRTMLEQAEALRWIRTLGIRCRDPQQRAAELSGGNQQKVVIARWLSRDCDILIFDEPTRGIDVGAKFEIYQLLNDLAGRGKAIIVISSDMKELMSLSDRIAVMSAGRLVATYKRGSVTQDQIMAAALSGYLKKEIA